jgi:uncharacterized membrane protein
VTIGELTLIGLRVVHALGATVWLGGAIYYIVAIRPATADPAAGEFVRQIQPRFGEWAKTATIVMLGSGIVLTFNGLAENADGLAYVVWLALKIVAALAAFALLRRRRTRSVGSLSRMNLVLGLGFFAYVSGVVLSSVWT